MRHDEGALLAERGVELVVELARVLEDVLVFEIACGQRSQPLFLGEALEFLGFDAHEIAGHVGGTNVEQWYIAVVVHGGDQAAVADVEERLDILLLDLGARLGIEQGDLQDVALFENFARDPEIFGCETARGNAAAPAVAPVAHLDRRLVDVFAAHRHGAGEAGHAAPALCLGRSWEPVSLRLQFRACAGVKSGEI